MNRPRPSSPAAAALVAGLAAATSWIAMLSWRPLAEDTSWTWFLLVGCVLVGATGATGRWLRLPRALVVAVQVALATVLLLFATTGVPFPTPEAFGLLADEVAAGGEAARQYTVPVPADQPVTALFLLAGLAVVVVVDLLAVGLSRVGLAGVVLLAVHVLPANLDLTPSWAQFALVALGFLLLLHLVQVETFHRWDNGPAAPVDDAEVAPAATGPRAGAGADRETPYASTPAALTIAAVAVSVATVTGALVPVSGISVWDGPGRGQGSNGVSISNPLVDMRRDLSRGWDMPLLRVSGETQRRPTYVRLATLNSFNGREWSSGNRTAPASQGATGVLPDPPGVEEDVPRQTFSWRFTASQAFDSRWLPTPLQVAGVDAPGDWRYDLDSRDFVAWDKELTTAGLSWESTELLLDLKGTRLDDAPDGRRSVDSDYTELPDNFPAMVEDLAEEVAGEESSQFRQARALQAWFRQEFTYNLEQVQSVGNDDLVAFLSEDGREGYCEQFAAAMAVMARSLGIPARVVVGFLAPEKVSDSTWVFSAHDLHAWPELFFPGSGWVRFEPTPADRASRAPSYSTVDLPAVEQPSAAPSSSSTADPQAPRPENQRPDERTPEEKADAEGPFPWQELLTGLLVLLAAAGVGVAPRTVRTRRRARRLESSDPEQWWAEVRDTAVDLGLEWPAGRSVRVSGAWLARELGRPWSSAEPDEWPPTVPEAGLRDGANGTDGTDSGSGWTTERRGAERPGAERLGDGRTGLAQLIRTRPLGAQDPVARLVGALEQSRYGREGRVDDALRQDAVRLREELLSLASRGRRAVATWLPRSLRP